MKKLTFVKKSDKDFKESLALGHEKEKLLLEVLNLNGIPAILNNNENVRDIDIELTKDGMYVDSKYFESVFMWSKQFTGIEPENCVLINKTHVEAYEKKEKETGKRVWVVFLINFENFGIYEYRFFPNSYFVHQLKMGQPVNNNKMNVDRTKGYTLDEFKNYIGELREIISKQ